MHNPQPYSYQTNDYKNTYNQLKDSRTPVTQGYSHQANDGYGYGNHN